MLVSEQSQRRDNVIAVDFKRRRRLAARHCYIIRIVSFSTDPDDPVPRSFKLASRLVLIGEILDRWPAQDYRYFKVRSAENAVFFLRHDVLGDEWTVIT